MSKERQANRNVVEARDKVRSKMINHVAKAGSICLASGLIPFNPLVIPQAKKYNRYRKTYDALRDAIDEARRQTNEQRLIDEEHGEEERASNIENAETIVQTAINKSGMDDDRKIADHKLAKIYTKVLNDLNKRNEPITDEEQDAMIENLTTVINTGTPLESWVESIKKGRRNKDHHWSVNIKHIDEDLNGDFLVGNRNAKRAR